MQLNTYVIDKDRRFKPSTYDTFLEEFQARRFFYWVQAINPDRKSLQRLFSFLSVDSLTLDCCLEPHASAHVSPSESMVLCQLPVQNKWNDTEYSVLSILCFRQAIVTVQTQRILSVENLLVNFAAVIGNHEIRASSILYLMLDQLIDEDLAFVVQARQAVVALERAMSSSPDANRIGWRVLELKRIVGHLEIMLEEQNRFATALLPLDTNSLSMKKLRRLFSDTLSHLEHALRSVARIEERLSELHQHYLLVLQDRTNRRLKILTILSAVFMPLTLIAGIYGMNFGYMPELGWRYGYLLVLLLMAGLAGSLLLFFYRKGWFE